VPTNSIPVRESESVTARANMPRLPVTQTINAALVSETRQTTPRLDHALTAMVK
jgi:hypothetical protein